MARILVTCPEARANTGNGVTAARWASHLRALGHRVRVVHDGGAGESDHLADPDLLVALHARRSARAIARFRREHPERPTILALTGTDVYRDLGRSAAARRSLELADRIVVLQPLAVAEIPAGHRARARVIYQSVARPIEPPARPRSSRGRFTIAVLAHLRAVKDPLRAALAARRLPSESRIELVHCGGARDPAFELRARREMARNPRYHWLGDVPRATALRLLRRARALVSSSRLEGGANVLSEAAAAGVPVLASRIPGSVGLLGEEYPGYFPVGDTGALARLMRQMESDEKFSSTLVRAMRPLVRNIEPSRERAAWRRLLAELGVESDGAANRTKRRRGSES